MKKLKNYLVITSVAASLVGMHAPAHAWGAAAAIGVAASTMEAVGAAIVFSLETLRQSIAAAAGATTKAVEGSMKATITAASEQADAVYQKEGQRIITQAKVEAFRAFELAPNPCLTAGAAVANSKAQAGGEMNASKNLRDMITRQQATRDTGTSTLLRNYADSQRYTAGSSSLIGKDYIDADILATSLLMGAGAAGKSRDYTYDVNSTNKNQENAAKSFISNALANQPLPTLSEGQMKSDAGRQYVAMQRAEAAQTSLAQYSFINALSQNTKVPGLGQSLGSAWKTQMGIPDDISPNHLLAADVNRRFENPDWYAKMSQASAESVERETAFIGALNVKLQHQRLEVLNRIELLLAQMSINATLNGEGHQAALQAFNSANNAR